MEDLKIRLVLDGVAEVQSNAGKAADAMGKLGASTGKVAQQAQLSGQQMAQVSAQLQDFFVQIQGGQAPLTALLQQGSQLSAVFGGVGNAVRALASAISPMVAVLGTVGVTVGALAKAYNDGAKEGEDYTRALVLTGSAAGVTAGQLQAMAAAQDKVIGTQANAAEALAALAATGKVAGESLSGAAEAAVRLARVGVPLEETVKKFASLGKEPLSALKQLNEAENFLTESVYKQVKALEAQGRTADAAALAIKTYGDVSKERSSELVKSLGTLERGWIGVKDQAKEAWDAILNVGRPNTLETEIAKAEEFSRKLRSALAGTGLAGPRPTFEAFFGGRSIEQQLRDNDALIARLRESVKLADDVAQARRRQAEGTKTLIKADEDAAKAAKAVNAEREREAAALERALGLSGTYQKDLKELVELRQKGKLTEEQYVAAVQKLIQAQPLVRAQMEAQAEAAKQVADAEARGLEIYERKLDALNQSAEAVAKQVLKLQDEEAALALAAKQNVSLAEAIELVTTNRLEEQRAKALAANDIATVAALQREIDARRELARLLGNREAREVAKKSAEDAAKEWERASNEIERTITDALMRGFESGNGFIQTLRDTLVNTFKTLVLRPLLQPIVGSISGALGLTGLSGLAGAGVAGAGGLAVSGGLLGAVGLGGLSMTSIGSAIGAGFMNTIAGGTLAGGQAAGLLAGGASTGTGIAGLAGAALPWIGGAAVIANALGLFRSTEYKGTSIRGTLGMGDLSDYAVTRRGGSLFSGPKWSENFAGTNAASDAIQAAFSSVREATAAMAEQLGISGTAIRQFTQALYIDGNGKSAEQVQKELSDALNGASDSLARFALGTTAYSKAGESAAQTLERLAGSLTGVNGVLGALGQSLLTVGVAGGDTASQLLGLFGGLQQFQQAGAQYLDAYYTEAEKTAIATQQLTAQLAGVGLAVPASRDAYRQLVEAQDLNTESGRQAYAALLQLAPSFAQLVPAIEDLGNSASEAARLAEQAAARQVEAGRRVLSDLAQQQGDLQVELLRAQGDAVGAAQLARQQALARLSDGLSAQDAAAAAAAYDLNEALRQQVDALDAARAAAEDAAAAQARAAEAEAQRLAGIAQQRAGLEQQLLQLQGDTNALRALELAGLDESNRAIQERIFALEDAAAAEARAAQEREQEAQRLAGIAQQRAGLELRLLQMLGDTNALRALELSGLDESNRAIQERIFALEDAAAAEARAAQEREQEAQRLAGIAQQRAGLERQLLQLQGNTTALRALELAALDASNRELQQRIFDTQDALAAQQAANQAAAEAARAAQQQAEAAERVRDAWHDLSNTLLEEAQRILGIDAGVGQQTVAQAQSRFAITTAQARAGDQEAARLLPQLGRTLVELVGDTATSRAELERVRAQVAASLRGTAGVVGSLFGLGAPAGASATDTQALLSNVAATVQLAGPTQPAATALSAQDVAALLREVSALRAQVTLLKEELIESTDRTAVATEQTRDVLVLVTNNGDAMQVEDAS